MMKECTSKLKKYLILLYFKVDWTLNVYFCKENGGISYWVGDGFCDDINNIEKCDYDDGDCCGLSMKKNFCVQCICKGKSSSFKLMKEIELIITFP